MLPGQDEVFQLKTKTCRLKNPLASVPPHRAWHPPPPPRHRHHRGTQGPGGTMPDAVQSTPRTSQSWRDCRGLPCGRAEDRTPPGQTAAGGQHRGGPPRPPPHTTRASKPGPLHRTPPRALHRHPHPSNRLPFVGHPPMGGLAHACHIACAGKEIPRVCATRTPLPRHFRRPAHSTESIHGPVHAGDGQQVHHLWGEEAQKQ